MLVDTHCHLDLPAFEPDRDAVIAAARGAGVEVQVLPAIDRAGWENLAALCQRHTGLVPAYGLHPCFLHRHVPEDLEALERWLHDHAAVAVGECGLDFHDPLADRELQRRYFVGQLRLARDFDLPVIVHARRAVEEVIHTVRRIGGLRGVVHSFSGSAEQARQLWELDFLIGLGGPLTYPRARRLRQLVTTMPLQQLLLETDAPDQPLCGHQGQRNEPARLVEVVATVAALRGEEPALIAGATTANARRLFGLSAGAPGVAHS